MAQGRFKPIIVNDTGVSTTEVVAVIVAVLWMAGVGLFFLMVPPQTNPDMPFDSLRIVLIVMAIFLPVAIIYVAAAASRSARVMREESQRLQVAIDGIRETYLQDRAAQAQQPASIKENPGVAEKLEEIAKETQAPVSVTFQTKREAATPVRPVAQAPADDQPALALGTSAEDMTPPLPRPDLIRALNFPDTDQDTAGFAALRRALKDRNARQLVQASQDMLTLLSQDGIYMDDLRPDRARPEIWRRFARGERGRTMAALGGVRDRSSLALTAGRMREDTIFRDSAHHFLRKFDNMLVVFEPEASDEDLIALSETRTARAFMLLGRVTGAFD
jgi:hypothetical protein